MKFVSRVVFLCLCLGQLAQAQSPSKNILFIAVDDLRLELGCYGDDFMQTPNIDQLARSGMLFERAYCQQAICAASRISVMTGMRPDTTGVYDLQHPLNETLPDAMSLPRFFQENGYKTVSLGKIYHHASDDKAYWDVLESCEQPTYASPAVLDRIRKKTADAKTRGLKGKPFRHAIKGPAFEHGDVEDSRYTDGAIANAAIEQLQMNDSRPFFLAVGFKKPHLPLVAPKKYWDLYDPNEIEIPSRQSPDGVADQATTNWGELRAYDGIPDTGDCDDKTTRSLIHAYRACVSYVDAQIGRVIKTLDEQNLRDDTIIVLWGDHGWKLGEYGDWCKHTNFELDTHVPLIISGTGVLANKRSSALVEYIDIYPTLTQWCGLETPESCEGKSLTPLFQEPQKEWSEIALSQYPRGGGMGYSIRNGQWRYSQWRNKQGKLLAEELYDHSISDVCTVNLAKQPEHQQTVRRLDGLLTNAVGPAVKAKENN